VAELNFYEKPTCTTCKKTAKLLTEQGVDSLVTAPCSPVRRSA
jgi:arsenate reductase-like glutaredoxin family protein